jgi:hypothetical protein
MQKIKKNHVPPQTFVEELQDLGFVTTPMQGVLIKKQ